MDDIYAYIVFEKVAAPAWKKMLDAGRIGAEELSRMLPHTPVPGNYHGVPEAAALPKLLPRSAPRSRRRARSSAERPWHATATSVRAAPHRR